MGLLDRLIGAHYGRPRGLLGRYAGRRMFQQHAPENDWTLKLLQARTSDHILEVGFGGGYAISKLSESVTQGVIAGVDYSATMVDMARRRNARGVKQGRIDLHCADAGELPFAAESFDKAYSIHSIYFWPQPQQALRALWRVLKSPGVLVLTVLPKERFRTQNSADLETATFKAYSGAALQAMLGEAGFVITSIVDEHSSIHLSNYSILGIK